MRNAKTETMPEIAREIARQIEDNTLIRTHNLMKQVNVSSTNYVESLIEAIYAYHDARAERILETKGREKAKEYAEKQIVPELTHCKGYSGSMVRERRLLDIMEENAERRAIEVSEYFKDKEYIEGNTNDATENKKEMLAKSS